MQRRQLDGNVGNGGGIGRETPAEAIKIGQSAGIEFGLDGLGEFGLACAVMRQRQGESYRLKDKRRAGLLKTAMPAQLAAAPPD